MSEIRDKIERARAEGNAASLLGVLDAQLVAAQASIAAARQAVALLVRNKADAAEDAAEDHAPGAVIETLGGGSGTVEE